jgi:hypothetical protein
MNCNFDLILNSACKMVNAKCCNGRRKSCEVINFYCPSQRNSLNIGVTRSGLKNVTLEHFFSLHIRLE